MPNILTTFRIFIALLSLLYAGLMVRDTVVEWSGANGYLLADGASPVGGDFINTYAAGALVATGRSAAIYDPPAFVTFERTVIPANIGVRLWAYPPTSLVLVLPFGLFGFQAGLAAWSALGLIVLALGARRVGLSWLDTVLLAISPASLSSVYFGQTGNIATGLLLAAIGATKPLDVRSALAAGLLTLKPQLGLLLPVLWLIQRRFALIGMALVVVLTLVGISLAAFGLQPWLDYLHKTVPALADLERTGEGPFTAMIPSMFMAVRLVAHDAQLAQGVHLVFAVLVVAFVAWRWTQLRDPLQQGAVLLVATALVTPYIHIYDLAVVFAGALLHLKRAGKSSQAAILAGALAALAAWALPMITLFGNVSGVPLGPPVMLAVLAAVAWPLSGTETRAAA